ncbi:hypothetical protein L0F63_005861 [Massospora cicadina]|nr:hypothetical protein L0F63_005861 [Massospora cicadina]
MQAGTTFTSKLGPASEQDPYLNWRESSPLIYNFLHFYTSRGRVNRSSLQWIDYQNAKERGKATSNRYICLTTRGENLAGEAETAIEILSLDSRRVVPGFDGFDSVTRLKRQGLIAASKVQERMVNAEFGVDTEPNSSTKLLYAATDHDNAINVWKLNRIVTSKAPLLLRLACSQVTLTHGIAFNSDNLLCTGASVLGTPAFALWDMEVSAQVSGLAPSSVGLIHREQPGSLMDLALGADPNLLYGATDGGRVIRWDRRGKAVAYVSPLGALISQTENSHDGSVTAIALNPSNRHLFATGGVDQLVKVWDIRKLASSGRAEAIHTVAAHTMPVKLVAWAPYCENLLASCSEESVGVFSASGEQLLVHLGHRSPIQTFAWCNWDRAPFTLASADYDPTCGVSTVQVWGFDELIAAPHMPSQGLRIGKL